MWGSWSTKCPALTEATNWTENRHNTEAGYPGFRKDDSSILRFPKDLFEFGKRAKETKIKTGERECSSTWLNYFRLFWRKSFLLVQTPVTPVLARARKIFEIWDYDEKDQLVSIFWT